MAEVREGSVRKTLTDAQRLIDSGKHLFQTTRERVTRGDTRVYDSLVRVARSSSATFRTFRDIN